MGVFLDPCLHLRCDIVIRRPLQPLFSRWLEVQDLSLPTTGMRLGVVTHAIAVHVARREDDSLRVQFVSTKSALVQQGVKRVTHIVICLCPLVDHDDLGFIEVQAVVISWVEVQGASRMVGDRHTGLTDIGVGAVDVDLAVTGALNDHILNCGLANTGLAGKVD